jgi:type II secretory pathway component PulF
MHIILWIDSPIAKASRNRGPLIVVVVVVVVVVAVVAVLAVVVALLPRIQMTHDGMNAKYPFGSHSLLASCPSRL